MNDASPTPLLPIVMRDEVSPYDSRIFTYAISPETPYHLTARQSPWRAILIAIMSLARP
jgi:hypothetical protein